METLTCTVNSPRERLTGSSRGFDVEATDFPCEKWHNKNSLALGGCDVEESQNARCGNCYFSHEKEVKS
jgi:hypothetical protein